MEKKDIVVAVIGSGVMGRSIASHLANANMKVFLYDVLVDEIDREKLSRIAIEQMKLDGSSFTDASKADLIMPKNLTDHLKDFSEADWIIEAIKEDISIKRDLYNKIDKYRKRGSIISSNTSTIPLSQLIEGMSWHFCQDFVITHFFNPVRHMGLLELVIGPQTRSTLKQDITDLLDIKLGKTVIECKDTPGFIANRIGCYMLEVAVKEAFELGINISDADIICSNKLGFPKSGVFGLIDIIGLDLMDLIAASFKKYLSPEDSFVQSYKLHPTVQKLIDTGYTGRKGQGGYYVMKKDAGGNKTKFALNLKTGVHEAIKSELTEEDLKKSLVEFINEDTNLAKFLRRVLLKTLHYTMHIARSISNNVMAVDQAMQLGFNWKYGPFELIDMLGDGRQTGAQKLAKMFEKEHMPKALMLEEINYEKFYFLEPQKKRYYNYKDYSIYVTKLEYLHVADLQNDESKLVYKNASANLYNFGDNFHLLDITTKMNVLDENVFDLILNIEEIAKNKIKGLVITSDEPIFSAGANLKLFLELAEKKQYDKIEPFLEKGQQAMQRIKYSKFPVVMAVAGKALGGGAELILNAHHVVAYVESQVGLVETGVGLIPGWSGCKEMILNACATGKLYEVLQAFVSIFTAKMSDSAEQISEILYIKNIDIIMNRKRLISEARKAMLKLYRNFKPRKKVAITQYPTEQIKSNIIGYIQAQSENAGYNAKIAENLLSIFTAEGKSSNITEEDLLKLERKYFMELIKDPATISRIKEVVGK